MPDDPRGTAPPDVPASGAPDAAVLDRIRDVLGPGGWSDAPDEVAPHLVEPRGLYRGATPLVAKPATTAQTAEVVRLCAEARLPIVPQGGNTGLVGASVPFEHGGEIVLSMTRMNRIRAVDPDGFTMTVESGCILKSLQDAAAEADRLFPLSYGSEGTATIGGALSANSGGITVLRYGNTRDLALGIEAVLPDGRVLSDLNRLRKNNTGYDLKQLFIGAEGTLGIVTAAVVKLFPKPVATETALLAVPTAEAAVALFARARDALSDLLTSCEIMPRLGLDFALKHVHGCRDPLTERTDWILLIEADGGAAQAEALRGALEAVLERAFEDGLAVDGVLAESGAQRAELWRLREGLVEAQKHEGASIKHDVSVPVSAIPAFLEEAGAAIDAACPGIRPVPFGHLGDGNLHYNLNRPEGAADGPFRDRWHEINDLVHGIVLRHGGSISAEHGIGRLKRDALARCKDPVALDVMRSLKAVLDPQGLMNPGKVL